MEFIEILKVPQDIRYGLCLVGDTREALFESYPLVFDWVRDNGYRLTWRPHIIAFESERCV
jgi:7-carboxy-7-deazaguanine synthase